MVEQLHAYHYLDEQADEIEKTWHQQLADGDTLSETCVWVSMSITLLRGWGAGHRELKIRNNWLNHVKYPQP